MADLTYTALRNLNDTDSPAHVSGTAYTITFSPSVHNIKNKIIKTRKTSLAGTVQDTFQRIEVMEDVAVTNITGETYRNFMEFLHSVSAGEKFVFELISGSGDEDSYKLETNSFAARRIVNTGSGGSESDTYSISWTQRRV